MPRHGTGLGATNFPAANKLLMRYEADRAYKLHMQKLSTVRPRIDVKEPKRHNHLVVRLKQIQKEEERQAEIDHENKLLLNKMTHVLKYGGNIDNWNNYESRSLNFPYRERQNEDIARENLGIARRLETVRPKLEINKWEQQYQHHQYLKRIWSDSVKDFGEFTPRRFSRMSRTRSEEALDDTNDEDFQSVDTADEKKLPKLKKSKKTGARATKSETSYPVTRTEKQSPTRTGPTKLPKINANRADAPEKSRKEDGVSTGYKETGDDKSDVAQLFKIAKQLGRPEDIFIKTLIKKTHKQRMATKEKFKEKYELDLVTELKNGLGRQWEYLIDALLQDMGVADSYAVFDALSTSDMADVVELLSTRNNKSITALKESYRKEFSISLEEDIRDRTQPPTQLLLLTLQKGVRDESTGLDEREVKKDAVDLVEFGDGRFDSENGIFLKLLQTRSNSHLQAVLTEFKNASGGQDMLSAMRYDCDKEYFRLLNVLVQCIATPAAFYADKLFKHKLPSDPILVHILTSRSEIDMPAIKKAYKTKYGIDITDDIKSKPHPIQKCLVELANKGTTKKPADSKKSYLKETAASQQQQQQQQNQKPQQQQHKQQSETTVTKTKTVTKKTEQKVKVSGQTQNQDQASLDHKTDDKKESKPVSQSKQTDNNTASVDTQAQAKEQKPSDKQDNNSVQPDQNAKYNTPANNTNKNDQNNLNVQQSTGTVRPFSNFNADDDCDKLNKALSDEQADAREKVVVAIVTKRSNQQRQQLKATYEQKYKKNLMIDLESELVGDTEEIVLALMMLPSEYDAFILHEAVEGLGVAEPTLVAIVATRSAQELKAIRDHYQKAFKADLEKDLTRDCSDDLRNLLTACIRGNRPTGSAVAIDKAQADAQALKQAGVPSAAFTDLLANQNHFQVKATLEEYTKLAGEDIYTTIKKASLGDDEEGFLSITKAVEDPVQFFAERTHGCFTAMGTNNNQIIRLTVPRAEVDLEDIKQCYYEKYSQNLYDAVNSKCSGEYKNMLLAVIDK